MTYGRTGRRRHQLLEALRSSENPIATRDVPPETPEDPSTGRQPNRKFRPPTPLPPKVMAIAKSQMNTNDDLFPFLNIRKIKPRLPETNAWERPLPKCRERNIIRANDKKILSRLMPPLPEQEWNRLGELAKGERKWEGPIARRAHGTFLNSNHDDTPDGYTRQIENWILKNMGEVQKLNSRMMRNLWAKIWNQCPIITESRNPNKPWSVCWGRIQKGAILQTPPSGEGFQLFFGGMDNRGRRIQPSQWHTWRAGLNFDRRLRL